MKKIRNMIMAAALVGLAGCAGPNVEEVTPTTQRVDITINGDVSQSLFVQDDNLIEIATLGDPIVNSNEYHVDIDLRNGTTLCLVLYDMSLDTPLVKGEFSAYPFDFLEDRSRYLIAHYKSQGDVLYSTISDNAPNLPQVNVFEILDDTTNLFAKINNLRLYADNVNISINGTFRVYF